MALDIIKMTKSHSNKRTEYKNEIIAKALELTTDEYGPFQYTLLDMRMNRHRALSTIMTGHPNNIYVAPANKLWDENTIGIKVPIRRGLLNYRLLLIHQKDKEKFAQVKSLENLKRLTAGMRTGWVTTDIFHHAGMELVESQNFDGLFVLLNNHKFNYIPRAVYEIFDEIDSRRNELKNIMVEETLILHLPMPTYIYVSPQFPRIAKRLESGLRKMLDNGDLDNILHKYYTDDIKRANLKNRKIIKIDNPYYQDLDLLDDKTLWFQL